MNENQINFDEDLLITLRVDPSYDEPILNQVLRIAVYDEYHAYETYRKTIETFGNVTPFTNILEAEVRHFSALEPLLVKYNVPAPINNWYEKIELPSTLLECCEVGVAAEIDNIKMYDNLLMYVDEYPDIKDVLYRLQAASYNNHLPTFRACVQQYSNQNVDVNNIHNQYSTHQMPQQNDIPSQEDMMAKMNEFNMLAGKFASGEVSQEDLLKLLGNTNLSFVGGALLGAVGMGMFANMNKEEQE
jgi:rubrerythrin